MNKRSLIFWILGILLVNIVGLYLYFRWDLTEDKRYSVSEATQNMLSGLDEPVEIKVYLEGSHLPGGFERLKRAVRENLNEFKRYAGKNLSFEFIDSEKVKDRKALFDKFAENGVVPTTVFDQKGGRKSELALFPYAFVKYEDREEAVLLLKSNLVSSASPEEKLNQSTENVEYLLASAIQNISQSEKPNVGLIPEFTSYSPLEFRGLIDALKDPYNLLILDTHASESFDGLDALIILSPDLPVDEDTKFKIDQYVMKGGKVLFFVDGLQVDAVGPEGSYAEPLDVNLDDLLFNYGLRINKDIVKDGLNAAVIPLVVGDMGDQPNIQEVVYRYYPLVNNFGPSLITKDIGMVLTKYASTIDTVNPEDGLKKTPLLLTSPHTKILNAPALITFNEARTDTEEADYNAGVKSLAYLVEGRFKSLYKSNFSQERPAITESAPTQILVVSDGDIIRNEINEEKGTYYPLGFDKYFKHQYGNEDFLLNALAYMVDPGGVLRAKAKTIQIRPLDLLKIRKQKTSLQLLNVVLPILLLIVFGTVRYFWVKQKYARD